MKTKFFLRLLVIGFLALTSGFQGALDDVKDDLGKSGGSSETGASTNSSIPKPDFGPYPTYEAQAVYLSDMYILPEMLSKVKRELKKIGAELEASRNGTYNVLGPKQLMLF